MSAAWDELRGQLEGREVGGGVFTLVRRDRRFAFSRFCLGDLELVSIETLIGDHGTVDQDALFRGRLPIGSIQLRDRRFYLAQALPLATVTIEQIESVIGELARIAHALAPRRAPRSSYHAFDHYAQ
jgi:hypothetical protein